MKTIETKIGTQTEIEYGTSTLKTKLTGINHWTGGDQIRDYLTIDNCPRDITNCFIDINNNAHINAGDFVVETDCGNVVVQIGAGYGLLSDKKHQAIKSMFYKLLDD